MNKIYDLLVLNFEMFNFEWFYRTKEFLKGCTVLQDQGLYLEFNIKDLLLCLFVIYLCIFESIVGRRGNQGQDVLRTYAVV